jgi:N-acetylglutamate synthase-like GNAT family acetyltransferase
MRADHSLRHDLLRQDDPLRFEIDYLASHEQHLPLIAEWQMAEFGHLNPAVTLADRMTRLAQALQTRALPLALVALSEEGEPVGAAGLQASTVTHDHLSPWLSSVVVPSCYRGQGVASALALSAVKEARRLGFGELYLLTPQSEALYARLGWQTLEVTMHRATRLTVMSRATSVN